MTNLAQKFRKTIIISEKTKQIVANRICKEIECNPQRVDELTKIAKKLGLLNNMHYSLSDNEFERIINLFKTSEDSYLDRVSIEIDNGMYSINIVSDKDNNYQIDVDEAVKKKLGQWVKIAFTENQLKSIDEKLNEAYKEVEERESYFRNEEMKAIIDHDDINKDNLFRQASGMFY